MKLFVLVSFFLLWCQHSLAQDIDVEYDKKKDFTIYKSFQFGESQITTPSDQKLIEDATLNKWILNAITFELELKGLKKVDTLADLIVSYAEGTLARTDNQKLGPLALTPGANPDRNFRHDYRQSSFIIDLNDRSGNLIWRVNSTTNMTSAEAERMINKIVEMGFRKFARPIKKIKG